MKSKNRAKRGFTLVEVMVVCFLTAGLVALVGYMVIAGLRAQEFECSVRHAQTAIRPAMDRMVDDMRVASNVTSATQKSPFGLLGQISTSPSGVVIPSSYADDNDEKTTLYGVRTIDVGSKTGGKDTSRKVSFSVDNTIFTRLSDETGHKGQTTLSASSSIDNFVYVRWEVPYEAPYEVTRKVYNTNGGQCWNLSNETFTDERNQQIYAPAWRFRLSGLTDSMLADREPAGATLQEGQYTVASLLPEVAGGSRTAKPTYGKSGSFVTTNATMHFVVSHPAYRGHGGGGSTIATTDSIEPIYYTSYDRSLFRIDFYALVHKDGDTELKDWNVDQNVNSSMIARKFLTGEYPSGSFGKSPVTQLEISTQVRVQNRE